MEAISQWLAELNRNNHAAFAFVTVAATASVGVLIAVIMELLLKLVGMKANKTGQHH